MNESVSANAGNLSRLIFPEEQNLLAGDFREYFLVKRFNFIATINNCRELFRLYIRIDETWLQAIKAFGRIENQAWIVPAQLTIFAFREMRLASELLFSCCTTPGFSHLRSAIESFAHAQKILREPTLAAVWLGRDTNMDEYTKNFKSNLKLNLFPVNSGFAHLHDVWRMVCDAGPHPSVTSVGVSSSIKESEEHVHWNLDFFEVDASEARKNILVLLSCGLDMFKSIYSSFHDLLSKYPQMLTDLTGQIQELSSLKAREFSS